MGKFEEQQRFQQQQIHESRTRGNSTLICQRCSHGLGRIAKEFNFKCFVVLILSVSVFLSSIFWILPFHSIKSGFDAKDALKLSAEVQVKFSLQNSVSLLVRHIGRLEYDIFGEIGVPDTKVVILSMHQSGASSWTDVVFGVVSDRVNVPINPVSLSVLRSSLIELFLQQSNLTLTPSIFAQPSFLEILKFPGGITVIPLQYASIWQVPQILFNFTLYNSIFDIQDNFVEFKEELKFGLHLRSNENLYVQITNLDGSTKKPPITVQASIMSDLGILEPQRLKELAQTITSSPAKNLGLHNTVFGRVKEINLSSFLKGTLQTTPSTPSPSPSPESTSSYSAPPSYPPSPSPVDPPCSNCDVSSPSDNDYSHVPCPRSAPRHSFPSISNSLAPSMAIAPPLHPCRRYSPIIPPTPHVPSASPSHAFTPYSTPMGGPTSNLSPPAPFPFAVSISSARGGCYKMWILGFSGLIVHHLLCWLQ